MSTKIKGKIGKEIVVIECPDKKNNEHWDKKRNIANIPCPYRCILFSVPNSGKSTVIKNLLLNADPLYDRVVVVCCSKESADYNDLEPHLILDTLPSLDSFDRNKKNALIIDDFKPRTPQEKTQLDRFFGFVSSHCNTTIFLACQDVFSLFSPTIRRMANVFFLWRNPDENQNRILEPRIGLKKGMLTQIMDDLDFKKRDNLCIDMTPNTPYPMRKNIFEVIKQKNKPDLPD